ncbi:hypothetical protein PoB_006285100 [Plakobranchus ocellatus]|uniref:Transmembrane protein n=1 Tax=Plakobranchus ocellatus TaxID=259542 RepID=A0AAV4CX93_9GAST|nr:hypothetical protein PoB_006285100 [Plakobranchus ocellatus]
MRKNKKDKEEKVVVVTVIMMMVEVAVVAIEYREGMRKNKKDKEEKVAVVMVMMMMVEVAVVAFEYFSTIFFVSSKILHQEFKPLSSIQNQWWHNSLRARPRIGKEPFDEGLRSKITKNRTIQVVFKISQYELAA